MQAAENEEQDQRVGRDDGLGKPGVLEQQANLLELDFGVGGRVWRWCVNHGAAHITAIPVPPAAAACPYRPGGMRGPPVRRSPSRCCRSRCQEKPAHRPSGAEETAGNPLALPRCTLAEPRGLAQRSAGSIQRRSGTGCSVTDLLLFRCQRNLVIGQPEMIFLQVGEELGGRAVRVQFRRVERQGKE